MKFIAEYEDFLVDNVNDDLLLEKNFWNWLIKSRKFGDLISLRKVVKLSKKVAALRFEAEKRKLEIKRERIKDGLDPNMISQEELVEIQSYEDEALNIENQIQHKYSSSEYLIYVSDLVKLEEENKNIQKLRRLAKTKMDKDRLKKTQQLNKQQAEATKQQIELGNEYSGKFDEIDDKKAQRKKEQRDRLIDKLNAEKMKLQNDEIRARTEAKRKEGETQEVEDQEEYEDDIY